MRSTRTASFLLLLTLSACLPASLFAYPPATTPHEFDAEAVMGRVEAMTSAAIEPRYNNVVQGYIKAYVLKVREKSEEILGHSVVYFPLFEKYLAENNFPLDLRYLPVVESALNPGAVSRAGAVGLWQFMPETGREMGLRIDEVVDERRDPHKSTQAAMRYLQRLYDRYGKWELALAAYNSGPGRVNRAIKRGRSRDFWHIRRYLPRETRNYVPAFIAATYLLNHYEEHQLQPAYPTLDMQLTETVTVYENYSFYEIARVTGLPLRLLDDLNPAYRDYHVPADSRGHFITLPRRVMPAFREYRELRQKHPHLNRAYDRDVVSVNRPAGETDETYYLPSFYEVVENDNLPALADRFQCTVHQLRAWNRLQRDELLPGQRLLVYTPREILRFLRQDNLQAFAPIRQLTLPRNVRSAHRPAADPLAGRKKIYYALKKREKLSDVAAQVPGLTLSDLILLNSELFKRDRLRAGTQVCIRKL